MFQRSVHPTYLRKDVVLGRGFMPTEADEGLLSGYNSELINASEAFKHRTIIMGKQSGGIWAVTFDEIDSHSLPYAGSPIETASSHMHVDFNGLDAKQIKAKAAMLAELATKRGRRHPLAQNEQTPFLGLAADMPLPSPDLT